MARADRYQKTVSEWYSGQLHEEIANLQEVILQGRIPTWEEYRYLTGKLTGLTQAQVLFNDLVSRMENDNA